MKIPEVEDKFNKGNMVGALIILMKKARGVIRAYLQEMYSNMEGADAVITTMIPYGASDAAEKMNVPMIHTLLNPAVPTRDIPSVIMPHIPKCAYAVSHKVLEWGFYICFKKPHDWTRNEVVTGFWQIESKDNYIPSKELDDFLNNGGQKPYYIGFGSMPVKDVQQTIQLIDEALELINERAVVYLSYNEHQKIQYTDRIYIVNDIPHSWLFPRVKATVIHGGVGTCRATMMAGKPTLVVPFMGDQEFWGIQMSKIGMGPKPVKLKKLNPVLLSKLLSELNREEYIQRAKEIQKKLSCENGAHTAAREIDEIIVNSTKDKNAYNK